MKKSDFNYDLPLELIAQHPAQKRDESRLMVLDPQVEGIEHAHFFDLPHYLKSGDCLVLNNTKVIPARLIGKKLSTGIAVEFLLLKRLSEFEWEVLVRPGRRLPVGTEVEFIPDKLYAQILEVLESGNRRVAFRYEGIWEEILDLAGTLPLPPYIKEKLQDPSRYNTVYAKQDGSAAAPTAGLHFTKKLLEQIQKQGVHLAYVTLHVGLGTFRPVQTDEIEDHLMHSEYYEIDAQTAEKINQCKQAGGRIISVGTTSTRVLETVAREHEGLLQAQKGWTQIFLYPGAEFKIVDGLITNFHLPESTLLMLVSALAGRHFILDVYKKAVEEGYRFFSFGDAMLIQNKIPPVLTMEGRIKNGTT